jgi:hypothetical protein
MPGTPITRPGASRRPAATAGSGAWLVALVPLLTCCGVQLLAAGAVVAGWAMLGMVGAAAIVVAGLGTVLWWRHRGYPR